MLRTSYKRARLQDMGNEMHPMNWAPRFPQLTPLLKAPKNNSDWVFWADWTPNVQLSNIPLALKSHGHVPLSVGGIRTA